MGTRREFAPFSWLDAVKALALVGVMWNHLVEEFGPGPWFTNPSNYWPDIATRLQTIFPAGPSFSWRIFAMVGWLGDSAPGVFILASGFGLTWACLNRQGGRLSLSDYYYRRVGRLYPAYIAAHLLVLGGSLFVLSSDDTFASVRTLASLLGVRATAGTFYYLSPSWWFVWLVLQLYIAFPALLRLQEYWGAARFFAASVVFTFACRAFGLRYSQHLEYWMTGMFAGTRLAEFAAGMVLARLLAARLESGSVDGLPARWRLWAAAAYPFGLACSLTWVGSLASNLLVTIGMSGLFATISLAAAASRFGKPLQWLGRRSYGIYLIHQAPLQWTAKWYPEPTEHWWAAVSVMLLSVPAGWALEVGVARLLDAVKRGEWKSVRTVLADWISAAVLVTLVAVDPGELSEWGRRASAFFLGSGLVLSCWLGSLDPPTLGRWRRSLRWTSVAGSFTYLFGFSGWESGFAVVALTAPPTVAAAVVFSLRKSWTLAATSALATSAVCFGSTELLLVKFAPIESGTWGELAALEEHPTRVYALKPNQVTRLRYNNYDYTVRTNSFGLSSPEISLERENPDALRILVVGDAFSMPEGLEYVESYSALLERRLAEELAPRRIQVINGGTTGYGPVEESAQTKELLRLFHPDVVVYEFFINEFEEALLTPEKRLSDIGLRRSRGRRLVAAVTESQTVAHLRSWRATLEERVGGRPARWRSDAALLPFIAAGDNQIYKQEALDAVGTYLKEMREACDEYGARMVIYYVPPAVAACDSAYLRYLPAGFDPGDASKYDLQLPLRHLRSLAAEVGTPVIDLSADLRSYPEQPVYFPDSWHWTRSGHQAVAGTVAASLRRLGCLTPR